MANMVAYYCHIGKKLKRKLLPHWTYHYHIDCYDHLNICYDCYIMNVPPHLSLCLLELMIIILIQFMDDDNITRKQWDHWDDYTNFKIEFYRTNTHTLIYHWSQIDWLFGCLNKGLVVLSVRFSITQVTNEKPKTRQYLD